MLIAQGVDGPHMSARLAAFLQTFSILCCSPMTGYWSQELAPEKKALSNPDLAIQCQRRGITDSFCVEVRGVEGQGRLGQSSEERIGSKRLDWIKKDQWVACRVMRGERQQIEE